MSIVVANIQEEGRYAGPHKQMLDLAIGIREFDVEMVIVIPNLDSELFQDELTDVGLDFKLVDIYRLSKAPVALIKYLFYFVKDVLVIRKLLSTLNPDIVQCNGSWQFKGVLASRMLGIPVVWHLTDTLMPKFIQIVFNLVKGNYVRHFISASERSAKYYLPQKAGRDQIWTIQSPVATDEYSPDVKRKNSYWKEIKDSFKIITVGNITPVKGYSRLFQIAAKLRDRKVQNIQFVIVGRIWESQEHYYNSLIQELQDLKLDNITIVPGSKDVKGWLLGADMYLCSSNSEASPIAVWEALSSGLPVVSTNVGDVKEIVQTQEAGFVFNHDDIDGMADKIVELKDNSSMRIQLSKNARDVALKEFAIKIISEKHCKVYQNIVSNSID